MSRFEGRPIIVTGGASGIGRALTAHLAAEGARVGIFDVDEAGAREVAGTIVAAPGGIAAYRVDITDYAAVEAAVARFEADVGPLYGLVNNAGWDEARPFVDTDPAFWAKVLAINLNGPLNVTHAVCRRLGQRGIGRVVSISSDAGRVGSSGEAVYSAAKGGVIALMKTLAREFARRGVTFNTVCPGPTDTPLLARVDVSGSGKLVKALERAIPMGRLAQPDDFREVVSMFLSPASGYITGQTISVSGGLTMQG